MTCLLLQVKADSQGAPQPKLAGPKLRALPALHFERHPEVMAWTCEHWCPCAFPVFCQYFPTKY